MHKEPKKILIAVDGSEQSLACVRYAAETLAGTRAKLDIFSVLNTVPEAYWDLERYPGYNHRVHSLHAWAVTRRLAMESFMKRAMNLVVKNGFPRDDVNVVLADRKVGIARDIAFEAGRGYDALVLGRTGASRIKDLVLGSVANKLLSRDLEIPLWLVGGDPAPGRVLLAVDRSENALAAARHAGRILAGTQAKVLAVSVLRGIQTFIRGPEGMIMPSLEEEGIAEAVQELKNEELAPLFISVKRALAEEGLAAEQVCTRIVSDSASRAQSILETARAEGYGTIVVGRRGLSRVAEFFMGRVGHKVVQMARTEAVWIVP